MYDFRTEVYFVGKLFEELIEKNGIRHFNYPSTLQQMIQANYEKRITSFFEVQRSILEKKASTITFTEEEIRSYREFANNLSDVLASINEDCEYVADMQVILSSLEKAYEKSMLEIAIHNTVPVTGAFLAGDYRYYKQKAIFVSVLKDFINLMHNIAVEKRKIMINNIWQRLDSLPRMPKQITDDLPF